MNQMYALSEYALQPNQTENNVTCVELEGRRVGALLWCLTQEQVVSITC